MISRFVKDIGIYGISGILVKGISIILVPFYVRVLSTEDYGIIDLITIVSALAGIIFSLELYQSIARYYSDLGHLERKRHISTVFLYYTVSFILFGLVVYFFAKPVSLFIFKIPGKENILKIAVISIIINALFYYFQTVLRYSLKSLKYTITNIIFSVTTICFSIYFVLVLKKGLQGVYFGQIAGGIIGLIPALYFNKEYLTFSFKFSSLKTLLKFSLPLVPSSLGVYILSYIDRIFIQIFLTLSDLGIYGIGYRVASISYLFFGIINASFVPIVYASYKNEDVKYEISKIYRYSFFISLSSITILSIFTNNILFFLTTPSYYSAYKVIPFLLLSGLFSFFGNLFLGLSIVKKTKIIAYISIISALLNIGLNFLLIPYFGIIGASVSTMVSTCVIFLIQLYFSQKHYFIPLNYKSYLLLFLISIVFISSNYLLKIGNSYISIGVNTLLTVIYLLLCIYLVKIIRLSEIVQFLHLFRNKITIRR